MSMNVKKGDAVKIIAGADKNKTGQITSVNPSDNRVVVSGAGLTTQKHFVKPRNAQEKGGIVEKERPIDISNVAILCPSCGEATKIASKIETNAEGKKVKVRICKKCGESLDNAGKAKAKATAKKAAKKSTATKKTAKAVDKE